MIVFMASCKYFYTLWDMLHCSVSLYVFDNIELQKLEEKKSSRRGRMECSV